MNFLIIQKVQLLMGHVVSYCHCRVTVPGSKLCLTLAKPSSVRYRVIAAQNPRETVVFLYPNKHQGFVHQALSSGSLSGHGLGVETR